MTQFLNVRKNDLNLHHTQTKFLLGSDPVVKKMSWPVLKKCHDRMWQKRKPGSENNRSDSVRLDENFWKKTLQYFLQMQQFFLASALKVPPLYRPRSALIWNVTVFRLKYFRTCKTKFVRLFFSIFTFASRCKSVCVSDFLS